MTEREKKLLAGIIVGGVALALIASAYPKSIQVANDALKKKRSAPNSNPEPVITEDIDYVEVVDINDVQEEPKVVDVVEVKNKKWYSYVMFWKWNIFKIKKSC